jgi:hypothetical protein
MYHQVLEILIILYKQTNMCVFTAYWYNLYYYILCNNIIKMQAFLNIRKNVILLANIQTCYYYITNRTTTILIF